MNLNQLDFQILNLKPNDVLVIKSLLTRTQQITLRQALCDFYEFNIGVICNMEVDTIIRSESSALS